MKDTSTIQSEGTGGICAPVSRFWGISCVTGTRSTRIDVNFKCSLNLGKAQDEIS